MPGQASFAYFFFGDLSSLSGTMTSSSYSVAPSEDELGSSTAIKVSPVGSGAGLGKWIPSDFAVRNWLLYDDEGAEEGALEETMDGAGFIRGKKESEVWEMLTPESSRAFLLMLRKHKL